MAAERGQSSQKLVYLRDHTPRRSRSSRGGRRSPTPPPAELAAEAIWLGRCLLVIAATLVVYWLGVLGGATRPETDQAWRWTSAHALPHLFLAGSALLAARALFRTEARATLFVGVAAGALIVLALEGITRAMTGGELGDLSLSVRSEVLLQTATLAIGVWAASYALRFERRPEAD